jgi:Cu-Zn family superoxide dismutase
VKGDGTGQLEAKLTGATLGDGAGSLFGKDGTALVVHAGPDDGKTDPAGNSGARIACGVISHAK